MSWQFTFDPNRCLGCGACVVGCGLEHAGHQLQAWRRIHTFNPMRHPALPVFHLSLACHHCEDPACLRACPAGAYTQDDLTGAVRIHSERCMGCRFCTWACPHDAPRFTPATGTTEKCTFCHERLTDGIAPACVARCPVGALGIEPRGPVEARNHDMMGFPPSLLRPAVRFVPHRDRRPDRPTEKRLDRFLDSVLTPPQPKISLRGEWALWLLTLTFQVLVAWWAAMALGGPRVHLGPFVMAGGLAVLGSSMHLGHPERAWRAVRGIRTSWLSREVVLIAAFVLLGGATLGGVLPENLRSFGVWTTAVLGVLALFAVDRLYGVALKVQPWNVHSAQVLLGGLFLLGFWGNLPWLAWGAGGLKLLAYGARKVAFHRTGRPLRWGLSGLRVGFGLLMPFVGWDRPEWSVAWVLLGDALDRAEFYDELETDGPDRRLFLAMRQRFER